jgi:hypothetical protein
MSYLMSYTVLFMCWELVVFDWDLYLVCFDKQLQRKKEPSVMCCLQVAQKLEVSQKQETA